MGSVELYRRKLASGKGYRIPRLANLVATPALASPDPHRGDSMDWNAIGVFVTLWYVALRVA